MQVIPHITDEIKFRLLAMAQPDADGNRPEVVISEIGGTVGDIESQPFLETARQVHHDVGRDNIFFIHVSLVSYLASSGELKTKPTQHSMAALRSIGIVPDALVLRCDREVPEGLKHKIALMCDVEEEGVVSCADAASIYDIPKVLYREQLDTFTIRRLNLPYCDVEWATWDDLLDPDTQHPVIATMAEQQAAIDGRADLGGTMRLGAYPGPPKRIRCSRDSLRLGRNNKTSLGNHEPRL